MRFEDYYEGIMDGFAWVVILGMSGLCSPDWKGEQDGRLASAYFSPEYKNFDQHMQTVKNETTV